MATMVKIDDILRNTTASIDFSNFDGSPEAWRELLTSKLSDPQVPALIRAIMAEGFTVPIQLDDRVDYWGNPTNDGWTIGNGHHRLAIAILLGFDAIPVGEDGDEVGWYSDDVPHVWRDRSTDSLGAQHLANMINEAIDWENWPVPEFA